MRERSSEVLNVVASTVGLLNCLPPILDGLSRLVGMGVPLCYLDGKGRNGLVWIIHAAKRVEEMLFSDYFRLRLAAKLHSVRLNLRLASCRGKL